MGAVSLSVIYTMAVSYHPRQTQWFKQPPCNHISRVPGLATAVLSMPGISPTVTKRWQLGLGLIMGHLRVDSLSVR